MARRDTWKQPTPAMQLIVLHMNMEGHFANLCDLVIGISDYTSNVRDCWDELRELQPFIEQGNWDMTLAVQHCSDDCELTHCPSCGHHIIGNGVDLERNGGLCDGCRWLEEEANKERMACGQWVNNLRRLGQQDPNYSETLSPAQKALHVLMFDEKVVEHLLVNDPQALKQAQEALTGTSFRS